MLYSPQKPKVFGLPSMLERETAAPISTLTAPGKAEHLKALSVWVQVGLMVYSLGFPSQAILCCGVVEGIPTPFRALDGLSQPVPTCRFSCTLRAVCVPAGMLDHQATTSHFRIKIALLRLLWRM